MRYHVETVWQDVRYAILAFRRSPTLFFTVAVTIALGLGIDTALFAVFNETYFRPIASRRSSRRVRIRPQRPT